MVTRISVIVAAFNRAESLRGLLKSLVAQETRIPFEIIVADNGSLDATTHVARAARPVPPGVRGAALSARPDERDVRMGRARLAQGSATITARLLALISRVLA